MLESLLQAVSLAQVVRLPDLTLAHLTADHDLSTAATDSRAAMLDAVLRAVVARMDDRQWAEELGRVRAEGEAVGLDGEWRVTVEGESKVTGISEGHARQLAALLDGWARRMCASKTRLDSPRRRAGSHQG